MHDRPTLPFLSDLIFVYIGSHLPCQELGRLACSSARSVQFVYHV